MKIQAKTVKKPFFLKFFGKNEFMRGRLFGVKKSTWMKISLVINLTMMIGLGAFSIIYLNNNLIWFFVFCFFAGSHSLVKGFLFKLDSATYFGFTLLFIGIVGYLTTLFNLAQAPLYFLSAAGVAALVTFIFTNKRFMLMLGILLSGSGVIGLMYGLKIINLAIFLAIYLSFLFIFFSICAILAVANRKKAG